jgi:uncharacterized Zn-binding protein involved in type VI secretion
MGQPAAKKGDRMTAIDTHIIMMAGTPIPTPLPFVGIISDGLSPDVNIMGQPAAVKGSTADNTPAHIATPGGVFQMSPSNKGTIQAGSVSVNINGKPAARAGDTALTCNDPADLSIGQVVAGGSVNIG